MILFLCGRSVEYFIEIDNVRLLIPLALAFLAMSLRNLKDTGLFVHVMKADFEPLQFVQARLLQHRKGTKNR